MYQRNRPVEYFALTWSEADVAHLGVQVGLPKWQSFWEYLTAVLAVCKWATPDRCLALLGDNTASLECTLQLKGSGPMLAVARELAWRKGRQGLLVAAGHLPKEANQVADALSRLEAPDAAPFPAELASATRVTLAPLAQFWQVPMM